MADGYKLWKNKAVDNLKWANDNFKLGNYALVCYLAQQAIELLLKGYIYSKNKIPPRTHNLLRLSKICSELGLNLSGFTQELAVLSEYYFETRYPDHPERDTDNRDIALEALEFSREINLAVQNEID